MPRARSPAKAATRSSANPLEASANSSSELDGSGNPSELHLLLTTLLLLIKMLLRHLLKLTHPQAPPTLQSLHSLLLSSSFSTKRKNIAASLKQKSTDSVADSIGQSVKADIAADTPTAAVDPRLDSLSTSETEPVETTNKVNSRRGE